MVAVYVHGGVSGTSKTSRRSLGYAVEAGSSAGVALDAVERAVCALEDDPKLNAGYGATLDREGGLELEAGLVDGASGRCGAIAGVRVRNPIAAARLVLEHTPHVLLAGEGAIAFAQAHGLEPLEDTSPEVRAKWEEARDQGSMAPEHYGSPSQVDTVGAVALDDSGRLCAGSSTGGVLGKLRGRIGDSPLFGAGVYASPQGAVVGTGVGELFVETLACFRAGNSIERGAHPQEACEEVIALLGERRRTSAGLLALDSAGRHGAAFRGGSWSVDGPEGPVQATLVP